MDCILLAAGVGKRLGEIIPKPLVRLGGKPILIHTLEKLSKKETIKKIIITYPSEHKEEYKKILKKYFVCLEKIALVEGGETRQESVAKALEKIDSKYVLIHEAARPNVTLSLIDKVIKTEGDCIIPVTSIPFTVVGGKNKIEKIFKRDELKNVQLPQKINTKILKEAHIESRKERKQFTDDSTLVYNYGTEVIYVEGEDTNIKITTKTDMKLMNLLMFPPEEL